MAVEFVQANNDTAAEDVVSMYLGLMPHQQHRLSLSTFLSMTPKQRRVTAAPPRRWSLIRRSSVDEAFGDEELAAQHALALKRKRMDRWTGCDPTLLSREFKDLPGTMHGCDFDAPRASSVQESGSVKESWKSSPLPSQGQPLKPKHQRNHSAPVSKIALKELKAPGPRLSSRCISACNRRFSLPSLREF